MPDSHELSYSQCQALLRAGVFGRIAFSTQDGPVIIPVNYATSDSAVFVRTADDSQLAEHGVGSRLAFEIDHVDYVYHRGWSVMLRGTSVVVDDPVELARIRATWEPRPWASGDRSLLIKLPITELTGRRLGSGWEPMSELPVRRTL
jgi:uncharacterized protein